MTVRLAARLALLAVLLARASAIVAEPVAGPFSVDGQSSLALALEVRLNGEPIAEARPPRQTLFSTVLRALPRGENVLEVRWRVVEVPAESRGYGPSTYVIRVRHAGSAALGLGERVLLTARGPEGERPVGTTGTERHAFVVP